MTCIVVAEEVPSKYGLQVSSSSEARADHCKYK
eukprot:CAMPEP_0116881284 /NCGR_PEP_ID=MMETSP0463-20121206/13405_1 /TAXON_ID=181622 /ORGANISM="Strombidinopsis sp, Strain SopsisLIS2011" /LENGTH=32 /DNA_ID= /DNA_START= /DNA_END= /DNA_ORIENTATION=